MACTEFSTLVITYYYLLIIYLLSTVLFAFYCQHWGSRNTIFGCKNNLIGTIGSLSRLTLSLMTLKQTKRALVFHQIID